MELVKKQLKKRRSGEEHEKLQQLLQRMVSNLGSGSVTGGTCGSGESTWRQEVTGGPSCSLISLVSPLDSSGAARHGTAGAKAAAGAAPGPEAGAAGSGPAGPSAILPEEM